MKKELLDILREETWDGIDRIETLSQALNEPPIKLTFFLEKLIKSIIYGIPNKVGFLLCRGKKEDVNYVFSTILPEPLRKYCKEIKDWSDKSTDIALTTDLLLWTETLLIKPEKFLKVCNSEVITVRKPYEDFPETHVKTASIGCFQEQDSFIDIELYKTIDKTQLFLQIKEGLKI